MLHNPYKDDAVLGRYLQRRMPEEVCVHALLAVYHCSCLPSSNLTCPVLVPELSPKSTRSVANANSIHRVSTLTMRGDGASTN